MIRDSLAPTALIAEYFDKYIRYFFSSNSNLQQINCNSTVENVSRLNITVQSCSLEKDYETLIQEIKVKVTSRYTLTMCAIVGLASATSASAASISVSSFSAQFVGVDLATATILSDADSNVVNTSVAFVERIDLTAPGIGFTTTPPSGPLETTSQSTSQFLQATGAQVAINANFFSDVAATPSPEDLLGLAVSNGTVVSPQAFGSDDAAASLLITKASAATISPAGSNPIDLSNVFNAVSGNQIVTNGVDTSAITPTGAPHDPFGLDPRTGIGLSEDGQYLYLIAIDGRQPGYSVGVTTSDEAALMIDLGVFDGLNLDGGGSTALVQSGVGGSPDLIDSPSGSFGVVERLDGNNLGVFASALPTPESSTWVMMLAGFGGLALLAGRRARALLSAA
jgi:exopolysaccharide biosynthesis protein